MSIATTVNKYAPMIAIKGNRVVIVASNVLQLIRGPPRRGRDVVVDVIRDETMASMRRFARLARHSASRRHDGRARSNAGIKSPYVIAFRDPEAESQFEVGKEIRDATRREGPTGDLAERESS